MRRVLLHYLILFGSHSGACSALLPTPVLTCSFVCVGCISSYELLMFKSFFFSLHNLKSRFFSPLLLTCISNVKRDSIPLQCSLLRSGRPPVGSHAVRKQYVAPRVVQSHGWGLLEDDWASLMCQYGALLPAERCCCVAVGRAGGLLALELAGRCPAAPGRLRWSSVGSEAFSSALRRGYCLFKLCYNSLCGR